MSLLPTITRTDLFSSSELNQAVELIKQIATEYHDTGTDYVDSGNNGRHAKRLIATKYRWQYHDLLTREISDILTPVIERVINKKIQVSEAHILESEIPYLLHTDLLHKNNKSTPEYTIIIPLDNYDSYTVCFNEYSTNSNDFEEYKKNYTGELKLKIDPFFCAERLNHIYPKDLLYLSLHAAFKWNKGSMFAIDRRYYHCSDNYLKRDMLSKQAIILRTES